MTGQTWYFMKAWEIFFPNYKKEEAVLPFFVCNDVLWVMSALKGKAKGYIDFGTPHPPRKLGTFPSRGRLKYCNFVCAFNNTIPLLCLDGLQMRSRLSLPLEGKVSAQPTDEVFGRNVI